ncbi:MAG: protein TolR [Candidatus Marinimicrobia bacterium]|nr:protein TolR [Candidatus Neomarinimicrobiota bacterium]
MAFTASSNNGDRRGRRSFAPMAEINVTPMVDVMLVLLIIFIITAPLLATGVNVNLPQTQAKPLPQDNEPYQVTVEKDGTLTIGSENKVSFDELGAKLLAALEGNRDIRVYVRGDEEVPYGYMMKVIGEITGAGVNQVAFVTQPPKKTPDISR